MDGRRSQGYKTLGKRERGLIRAYAEKVTWFSVSQMTRLIRRNRDTDRVRETAQDIALLAQVDRAHGRLSGPATCAILRREPQPFGQKEYARLAEISFDWKMLPGSLLSKDCQLGRDGEVWARKDRLSLRLPQAQAVFQKRVVIYLMQPTRATAFS